MNEYRRHRPSFFFPIALITVGVIWLLVNNGTVPVENIYRLLPLWPVLLIAGGLALLLRRIWWPLDSLIWLGVAGLLIWSLVYAPSLLPSVNTREMRQQTLQEPIGDAQSAAVTLNLSINPTNIHALEGGDDLLVANLYVMDEAFLDVSGQQEKNVTLRQVSSGPFNFFNFEWLGQAQQPWDIGLTTQIPLELEVDASTGSTDVDLTGIQLEALTVDGSTGSMNITLPSGVDNFPFVLDASTGSVNVVVPDGTGFDLEVDASTGSITIDVPDDAGVQVEVVDGGTGGLNLPAGFTKVRGDEDDKEGLYENAAFAGADAPIRIRVDMSTGGFNVR